MISVDDSVYLYWQLQLLQHSHARVGQPGALTRLVATNNRDCVRDIDGVETVTTQSFSPHAVTGDEYAPYNKPGSLNGWLSTTSLGNETLLLIDPDCVFIHQVTTEVTDGEPIGENATYLRPRAPEGALVIRRHCRRRQEHVQSIGIPIFITPSDLRAICPRWQELTCQIRDDSVSCDAVNWVSEMWGYAIAAAELGLNHQVGHHACLQFDTHIDLPLLHYCYDTENEAKTWRWGKREYRAWSQPDPAPPDVPLAGRFLHSLVEELANKLNYQIVE